MIVIRYLLFKEAESTCPKWWAKISDEGYFVTPADMDNHVKLRFGNSVSFVVDPPRGLNRVHGDRYLEFENEEAMTAFFLQVDQ